MASMATDSLRRHRLTVHDYYRMAEVGILPPDARVELIEGEIIDMAPNGSRHAGTIDQLAAIFAGLERPARDRVMVRVQNPIRLDEHSEPKPDVALLRPRADFYKSAHPRPADVLLIIEVADTSLRYDREIKMPLYARYGIPELWVVDIIGRSLTRYRDPREGTYARIDRPDVREPVMVDAIEGLHVELGAVFL
jgi:Uma2 family endonuclease